MKERPLRVLEITRDTLAAAGEPALLDNLEVLFEPQLQSNPLALLQGLSRDQAIIASWPGSVSGGLLRCATPGHPEHRAYPTEDLVLISLETGMESSQP